MPYLAFSPLLFVLIFQYFCFICVIFSLLLFFLLIVISYFVERGSFTVEKKCLLACFIITHTLTNVFLLSFLRYVVRPRSTNTAKIFSQEHFNLKLAFFLSIFHLRRGNWYKNVGKEKRGHWRIGLVRWSWWNLQFCSAFFLTYLTLIFIPAETWHLTSFLWHVQIFPRYVDVFISVLFLLYRPFDIGLSH